MTDMPDQSQPTAHLHQVDTLIARSETNEPDIHYITNINISAEPDLLKFTLSNQSGGALHPQYKFAISLQHAKDFRKILDVHIKDAERQTNGKRLGGG